MEIRDYQLRLAKECSELLRIKKIAYLAMEVRTGKTITSLQACEEYGAKKVLFLTKKKAISSIQWDYDQFNFCFKLTVINDESMHLILDKDFDIVIHDEHHRFGAFPKPNSIAKSFKERFGNLPMIFLSGTPTPESHSQWFHQFWVSNHSPFKEYINFYKWANDGYVDIKLKYLGYAQVKDYSNADRLKIMGRIRHYLITFTQKEAGFNTSVNEMVLFCDMKPITHQIITKLHSDLVVKNKEGKLIVADSGVKLQQKTHQLYSGTVKFEDGTSKVIDYSKAEYIYENFKDSKIAIFYNFVEEYNALKEIIGERLTNDLEDFNSSDKWIALQIVSGREGISLKMAKYLVYYNIAFSAVSYWQSRDRLTTMDRQENEVFYIFAKGGIEEKIYKSVLGKKDYTLALFRKDYKITSMHQGSRKYIQQYGK